MQAEAKENRELAAIAIEALREHPVFGALIDVFGLDSCPHLFFR